MWNWKMYYYDDDDDMGWMGKKILVWIEEWR
jgi:hypothetical protein